MTDVNQMGTQTANLDSGGTELINFAALAMSVALLWIERQERRREKKIAEAEREGDRARAEALRTEVERLETRRSQLLIGVLILIVIGYTLRIIG